MGRRRLGVALEGAASGSFAASVFMVMDLLDRARWGSAGPLAHASAAGGLLIAVCAVLMALVVVLIEATRLRRDTSVGVLVGAMVAMTLSGVAVRSPVRGWTLGAAIPLFGFVVAAAMTVAWRVASRRARRPFAFAAHVFGSSLLGVGLIAIDARLLRGRRPDLHLAIELLAFLLLAGAALRLSRLRPWIGQSTRVVGVAAMAWALFLLASPSARNTRMATLRHLTSDPSAVGALYARGLLVNARLSERGAPGRHDDAQWNAGERETADETEALARLRASCADCNIVVYFVDTLRADTATDPAVMPAASSFAESSIRFPRAYSTGSDTLGALSTLLSGRYDGQPDASVLRGVRSRGIDNGLFISTSAHEYLTTQLPEFRFDEAVTIADHAPDAAVWGYGADIPTGDDVTRAALSWMKDRRERRFFSWVYNFDLHGWRQLRDEHLPPGARIDQDRPDTRYRAVAGMVDRSFQALLDGLDALGIAERTIVLLVSDHGEALGYRGFWTHSTFLWQSLVRVPMALRIPGLAPRELSRQVSLVDVAPTLARFVDPSAEMGGYHGVDLLRFYADPSAERTLPLLMQASSEGKSTQYGLVASGRKLIVASGGGPPLLHDLDDDDPDGTDLTPTEPDDAARMLHQLNGSPIVSVQ